MDENPSIVPGKPNDSGEKLPTLPKINQTPSSAIKPVQTQTNTNLLGKLGKSADSVQRSLMLPKIKEKSNTASKTVRNASATVQREIDKPLDKSLALEKHRKSVEKVTDFVDEKNKNEVDELKKKLTQATRRIENLNNLSKHIKAELLLAKTNAEKMISDLKNRHEHEMKRARAKFEELGRKNDQLLELLDKSTRQHNMSFLEDYDHLHLQMKFEQEKLQSKKDDLEVQSAIQSEQMNQFTKSSKFELVREMNNDAEKLIQSLLAKHGEFERGQLQNKRTQKLMDYQQFFKLGYVEMVEKMRINLETLSFLYPTLAEIEEMLAKIKNIHPEKYAEEISKEHQNILSDPLYSPIDLEEPLEERFMQKYHAWINDRTFMNHQREVKGKGEQQQKQNRLDSNSNGMRNKQPGTSQGR